MFERRRRRIPPTQQPARREQLEQHRENRRREIHSESKQSASIHKASSDDIDAGDEARTRISQIVERELPRFRATSHRRHDVRHESQRAQPMRFGNVDDVEQPFDTLARRRFAERLDHPPRPGVDRTVGRSVAPALRSESISASAAPCLHALPSGHEQSLSIVRMPSRSRTVIRTHTAAWRSLARSRSRRRLVRRDARS